MTNITIYSHFADCPEWRMERTAQNLSTDPTWTGDIHTSSRKHTEALEQIFRLFNRVNDADCERLMATGYTLPSLSAGDIVTIDNEPYLCANIGWIAVDSGWVEDYKAMPYDEKWREVWHIASER
jgi:hypothetical protein